MANVTWRLQHPTPTLSPAPTLQGGEGKGGRESCGNAKLMDALVDKNHQVVMLPINLNNENGAWFLPVQKTNLDLLIWSQNNTQLTTKKKIQMT